MPFLFLAELLVKDYSSAITVGTLGLLRVLLPLLLSRDYTDKVVLHKIIEIYEICVYLLEDPSHTIVNASLECVCIILENPKPILRNLLSSMRHVEILRRKKTLKNLVFNRKSSASSAEILKSLADSKILSNQMSSSSTPKKHGAKEPRAKENFNLDDEFDNVSFTLEKNKSSTDKPTTEDVYVSKKVLDDSMISTTSALTASDERALLTGSDIEMDSFRSAESEMFDTCFDSPTIQSPTKSIHRARTIGETGSLKSQKSTESIGSFINSILTHPNTGKVEYLIVYFAIYFVKLYELKNTLFL